MSLRSLVPLAASIHRLSAVAALALTTLAGCRGAGERVGHAGGGANAGSGDVGGTLVLSVPTDPRSLLPPQALGTQTQLVVSLLFDRLAEIGDSLNTIGDLGFEPRLAQRWDWSRDSLAITFHLDPRARWHDGVPVRSNDVRFTYRMYTDSATGAPAASQLTAIDSVTTPDSLTAVFWFKHRYPEQFFDATYQMLICPAHLLATTRPENLASAPFGHHPVGDGRFRFASWTPGAKLELVADTGNYRGRPKLDRVILSMAPDGPSAFTQLLAGAADLFETLREENFAAVRVRPELTLLPYEDASFGFLWFNLHAPKSARPHPLLGNRALRRALAMALDRAHMVRNVFDTLAVVAPGPFARSSRAADTTVSQLPYDTAQANHVLDSLGWRPAADGVRRRNGRPLTFTMMVPTSSVVRRQFAVLIQDQLARVGVAVTIEPVEFGVFVSRLQQHDFDAAIHSWQTDPSLGGIRQQWTRGAERDGTNYGGYENAAFDSAVDSALAATAVASRRRYFHQAYSIITDDAPAVWLYQTRHVAGIHRRIRVTYLRPDGWWAHLADWYIPASERIPRDRIGLSGTAP